MSTLFIIVTWVFFVGANILMGQQNDAVRRYRIANKNTKQIEHFWYGLGYCLLCGIPFYISRSWIELISLLLLHASIFPCAYNYFSDNPIFHLSQTSNSIFDKTLVKLGLNSTEEVNIIAFCLSVILIVVQIILK